MWRGPTSIRENGFETKTPKRRKKLINRSRQAIFRNDHYSDPRFDTPARPKFLRFAFVQKNVKNAIFKTSSVLQPQGLFVVSKHKCVKKSNLKKKQMCKRPQAVLKTGLQNQGVWGRRRGIPTRTGAKSLPKPLFWCVSRLCTSSTSPLWADTPKTKITAEEEPRKRRWAQILKNGLFAMRPDFATPLFRSEICKMQTRISHCKINS